MALAYSRLGECQAVLPARPASPATTFPWLRTILIGDRQQLRQREFEVRRQGRAVRFVLSKHALDPATAAPTVLPVTASLEGCPVDVFDILQRRLARVDPQDPFD